MRISIAISGTGDAEMEVSDQSACQQRAVDAGAPFYSLFEPDGVAKDPHTDVIVTVPKCYYSTTCDSPKTKTTWPWKRYSKP